MTRCPSQDAAGNLRLRLPLARDEADVLAAQRDSKLKTSCSPSYIGVSRATEILRQSLVVARAGGVERVLVTCDDDNLASREVIEANGGVLDNIVDVDGVPLRRYWVD